MRLSIGVPAYNQGSFLRQTLESLLHQDVPFHEIVVSNNHSTDSTADVIAAMQLEHPNRIRCVVPPTHLNAVENWNYTCSQLTGDWISLLSSDDLALSNFVHSVQNAVALSPNATILRAAWRNIDMEGRPIEDRYLLSVSSVSPPAKTLYEQRFGPKASFAAFALRRDIWQSTGGFPEEVALIGDWGLWLLAGALGNTVYAPEIIAEYRVGHQSAAARRRMPTLIAETHILYDDIMPRATQLGGFGRPSWIAASSAISFRNNIKNLSRDFAPAERAPLVEAFQPWAVATGQEAMLRQFERGKVFRQFNLFKSLKPWLRKVYLNLRRSSNAVSH
jgi:glycosyltransferase involved in cell wall biosynthesis